LSISSDKFPPIHGGELSFRILRKTLVTKLGFRPSLSKKELDNILKTIKSALMILKYSYLQQEELANHEEIETLKSLP
jgi:predicted RNA-binding protein with EMAP domain